MRCWQITEYLFGSDSDDYVTMIFGKKGIKMNVKVEFTEGHEKRFTQACCRMLVRREKQGITAPPQKKERQSAEEKTA